MISILIMNGPNLNLLGTRQKDVYGATNLKEIETICRQQAASVGAEVTFFQSNNEGDLIDQIHAARGTFDGIILNAGAYSHTSIAIMDALLSVQIPTIDMHLSNIHRREEFRHTSYVAKAAIGSIAGFGPGTYLLAIDAMMMHLDNARPAEPAEPIKQAAKPLETNKYQVVGGSTPSAAPAPAIEKPAAEVAADAAKAEVMKTSPSALAAEIAAAAAAAIAEETRNQAEAVAEPDDAPPEAAEDTLEDKSPEADAAPEPEPQAKKPTDESADEAAEESSGKSGGFNEMFETPSKDVLDSLGIAAPELYPPVKREEAPKPAKSPGRSFRKLS